MKIKKALSIILVAMILSIQPALVAAEDAVLEKSTPPKTEASALKLMGTVKLTSGNLNVRKGPSIEDEIIGKLPNETKVEVLEQSEDWATITHNGARGFVSLQYLTVSKVISNEKSDSYKKIIVLDPGHGGRDPGAIAKDGTYESDLVWQYTEKSKIMLEQAG